MSIPFALSLSKYVNSAGTDVGFASLLGVALLALLYFAGARESRTLRDQLEDAHSRIAALEARLTQALRTQNGAPRTSAATNTQAPNVAPRPGVVPAPRVAAQPMGSAVARVQRATPAPSVPVLIGAPAGAGAPALGSSTKLIPTPESAPALAPAVAAGAGSSASSMYLDADDDEFTDDFGPDDTMFAAATAAASNGGGGSGPGPVALPPRMQVDDDDAPSGPPPRRTIPTVDTAPSRSRRVAGRVFAALLALVVIAAVVVALLVITSSGSNTAKTTAPTHAATTRTRTQAKSAFDPAKVKVSVLNGTAVAYLAADVGKYLTKDHYTVPAAAITNAAVQTATTTTVGYLPGFKADAVQVAKALTKASGVSVTSVSPASATSITSCGTPTGSGQAGSCPANVIVTVGTDLAGAASTSTSTSG